MKISTFLITLLATLALLSSCTEESVSPTKNKNSIISYKPTDEKFQYRNDTLTHIKEDDFMYDKTVLKTPQPAATTTDEHVSKDESLNTPMRKIEE